ncbi:MAG TPA: 4Fe-4S dicluster domain-containing protein [Euryarchaeota archaeon]|nr:4Fe-4S dicluster domain-containing protein [Euryarchaeota archaeon]
MVKKYGFVIDLRKCVACYGCQSSCRMENKMPMGVNRARVGIIDTGEYPNNHRFFLPVLCNHCDNPPCVKACPVPGATYKRDDGLVLVNEKLCIGCGYCVKACPYDARFINPSTMVADKCTYCAHRIAEGLEEPACVRNCIGHARYFGDMNDPNSEISRLLAENETEVLREGFGTKPNTYYIMDNRAKLLDVSGVDER